MIINALLHGIKGNFEIQLASLEVNFCVAWLSELLISISSLTGSCDLGTKFHMACVRGWDSSTFSVALDKAACSTLVLFAACIVWGTCREGWEQWTVIFSHVLFQLPNMLCSTGNCKSASWCSLGLVNVTQVWKWCLLRSKIWKDLLSPCHSTDKSGRRRCVCTGEHETLAAFHQIVAHFSALPYSACSVLEVI